MEWRILRPDELVTHPNKDFVPELFRNIRPRHWSGFLKVKGKRDKKDCPFMGLG
jgi:hypothetical protein